MPKSKIFTPPQLPTRTRLVDGSSEERKTMPMVSGLLDYFPDALAAVSNLSFLANEKHNPGEPMHHARGKSMDHADTIIRHLVKRGEMDVLTTNDGRMFLVRHSTCVAWRALALLQLEIEHDEAFPLPRAAKDYTHAVAKVEADIAGIIVERKKRKVPVRARRPRKGQR